MERPLNERSKPLFYSVWTTLLPCKALPARVVGPNRARAPSGWVWSESESQEESRIIWVVAHAGGQPTWSLSCGKSAAALIAAARSQPLSRVSNHFWSGSGSSPWCSKNISVPTEQTSTSGSPRGTSAWNPRQQVYVAALRAVHATSVLCTAFVILLTGAAT